MLLFRRKELLVLDFLLGTIPELHSPFQPNSLNTMLSNKRPELLDNETHGKC